MKTVDTDMEQELEIFNRRRRMEEDLNSQTLPPSPCHSFSSSSSSDFEFSISITPRKSSTADELFYKGQLLPLHLSQPPRMSMVRTLILSSSSTTCSCSSTDTSNTNSSSRDSTGSRNSNDSQYSINSDFLSFFPDYCDSSRPSSIIEDDEFKRLQCSSPIPRMGRFQTKKNNKYFRIPRFSSVFCKKVNSCDLDNLSESGSPVKGMSGTVREVIRKYLKKVKPLYEKLSQQKQQQQKTNMGPGLCSERNISISSLETERSIGVQSEPGESRTTWRKRGVGNEFSQSSSGNLRYPRRVPCVSSCPSSMMSSPCHSVELSPTGFSGGDMYRADSSSTEELQNAIQGAIAHCKNSMLLNKTICDKI